MREKSVRGIPLPSTSVPVPMELSLAVVIGGISEGDPGGFIRRAAIREVNRRARRPEYVEAIRARAEALQASLEGKSLDAKNLYETNESLRGLYAFLQFAEILQQKDMPGPQAHDASTSDSSEKTP